MKLQILLHHIGAKTEINKYDSTNALLNRIKKHNLTNIEVIILSCHKMLQLSLLEFVNSKNNINHIKVLPTLLNILNIKDKTDLLDLIKSDFNTIIPDIRTSDQETLYDVNTKQRQLVIPKQKKQTITQSTINNEIFMDNQTQLQIYRRGIYCVPDIHTSMDFMAMGSSFSNLVHSVSNFRFFIDQFIQAAISPKKITKTYINYVFIVLKFIQFLINNYNEMQKNNGNNNIIIDIFICFFINIMNFLSMLLRGLCLNENIATNILNSNSSSTSPRQILYSTIETNTTNAYKKFSEKHLTMSTQQVIDILDTGVTDHSDVIDYSSVLHRSYNFEIMTTKDAEVVFLNELAKSIRQSVHKKIQDMFYYYSTLVNYLNNYNDTFKDDKISTYKIIKAKESDMSITAYIRFFNALYYGADTNYIWIYKRFFSQNDIDNIFTIETEWTKAGAGTGVNEELKPYSIPHARKKNTDILKKLSTVYVAESNIENNIIPNLKGSDFHKNLTTSLDKISASNFADIYKTFKDKDDCVKQIFKCARTNQFLKQWSVDGTQLSPLHQYNIPSGITDITQEFKYNTYKLEVITNNKNIFVIEKKYTPQITYTLLQLQPKFKEFIKNTLQSLEFKYIIYMMVNMAVTWFFEGKVVWGSGDDAGTYHQFTGKPIDCGGSIQKSKSLNFTNDNYNPNITAKINALQQMGQLYGNPYMCLILPKITDNMEISITDKKNSKTQEFVLNNEKMSEAIQTANAKAILKQQQVLKPSQQKSTSTQTLNNDRLILTDTQFELQVL